MALRITAYRLAFSESPRHNGIRYVINAAIMLTDAHILYQHPDFIVLNKPAGLGMHRQHQNPGVISTVAELTQQSQWHLVHRLDKVTSGLLLLARSSESAAALGALFANRQIDKYYLALSTNKPAKKQGRVLGDMQKTRRGQWKLLASRSTPAITQFFSQSLKPGLRLFMLRPHTGKTHQLRVAMKSLSSPILGDRHYAGDRADRVYLHAYALCFQYQGRDYHFQCLPAQGQYFNNIGAQLTPLGYDLPWTLPWPKIGAKPNIREPD